MNINKVFAAAVALASITAAANAGTLDDIAKRGELRVAVQTQGPPSRWSTRPANGPAARSNSLN